MERVVPLKIPDFIECHFAIQSAGDNFGKRHKVDVRGIAIFARKIRHFLDIYFILVRLGLNFDLYQWIAAIHVDIDDK